MFDISIPPPHAQTVFRSCFALFFFIVISLRQLGGVSISCCTTEVPLKLPLVVTEVGFEVPNSRISIRGQLISGSFSRLGFSSSPARWRRCSSACCAGPSSSLRGARGGVRSWEAWVHHTSLFACLVAWSLFFCVCVRATAPTGATQFLSGAAG